MKALELKFPFLAVIRQYHKCLVLRRPLYCKIFEWNTNWDVLTNLSDKVMFYNCVSSCCMVDKCIAYILDVWLGLLDSKKSTNYAQFERNFIWSVLDSNRCHSVWLWVFVISLAQRKSGSVPRPFYRNWQSKVKGHDCKVPQTKWKWLNVSPLLHSCRKSIASCVEDLQISNISRGAAYSP